MAFSTIAKGMDMKLAPVLVLAGLAVTPAWAQLAPPPPTHPEPPPALKLIDPGPAVPDWLSYNYDRERTGWNRGETTLTPKTVGKMKPLWNTQLTTTSRALVLSTLTAPVVAAGVSTPDGAKDLVFSIGIDDVLSAVDANTGKIVWQKSYPNPLKPLRPPSISCSNTEQATPAIDKTRGVIPCTASDGRSCRAAQVWPTAAKRAADPRPTLGAALQPQLEPQCRGQCGLHHRGAAAAAAAPAQPVEYRHRLGGRRISRPDPARPVSLSRFYTGKGRPAGPRGATGVAWGPQGAYVTTAADGPNKLGSGIYGDMVLAVRPMPGA